MGNISELHDILNGTFKWNKSIMQCFIKMLMALLLTRTVNLSKIACAMFNEKADKKSRYRRREANKSWSTSSVAWYTCN